MTDQFEFATATSDELPHVVKIKLAMFVESGHFDLLAPNAGKIVLDDYRSLYLRNEAQHFVARAEGRIIASAGAFIKADLPFRYFRSPTYGFIGDVYTEPSFRGRGIATHLSQNALRWLRSRGITMVRLLASEAGRPLFTKLGFAPTDEMALIYAT